MSRRPSKKDRSRAFLSLGGRLTAAPDGTRLIPAERRKYEERKAVEAAEAQALALTKSDERPSDEDLLGDLVRVASDENLNPYWKDKTLSAARYRRQGLYPIEFVWERYGQFDHAKQVAGLMDEPGTRQTKAATANRSRKQHADRYIERTMLPYALDDPAMTRELHGTKLMLVISDTHATYLDAFTWWSFLRSCRTLRPDYVVLNGDILEGSSISRHQKIPGRVIPLQVEFDFCRTMLEQLREVVGPDTMIMLGAGNHDLDRWASYLTQTAPQIAGLRSNKFDELLDLDGLDIKLSMGGKIISPDGQERLLPGMLFHDFYFVHHGTCLGKHPAASELANIGLSGTSGHVHRTQQHYGTTMTQAALSWLCTPMASTDTAGRAYIKSPNSGHQKGYGVVHLLPGERVHQYPVVTDGGIAVVEGHIHRMRRMPKVQDITTNWLDGWDVPA